MFEQEKKEAENSSSLCQPCKEPLFPLSLSSQIHSSYQILDLTYPLHENGIFWPGESYSLNMYCCHVEEEGGKGSYDYASGTLNLPEHAGTHLDAPYHFNKTGLTIDQILPSSLISICRLIDIQDQCNKNPDYLLSTMDILDYERKYGKLQEKDIVFIRTGWYQKYPMGPKEYLGYDVKSQGPYDSNQSDLIFPGISEEAVLLLIDRKITAVGLDTASLDNGKSKDFIAHRTLLGAGIYGIENINQEIASLPATGCTVMIMPMKIMGGSGAPVRLLAFVPH